MQQKEENMAQTVLQFLEGYDASTGEDNDWRVYANDDLWIETLNSPVKRTYHAGEVDASFCIESVNGYTVELGFDGMMWWETCEWEKALRGEPCTVGVPLKPRLRN